MAVSKEDIVDAIAKLSVLEVVDLISDLEKKFGVTAAVPMAAAAAAAPGAAAAVLSKASGCRLCAWQPPQFCRTSPGRT